MRWITRWNDQILHYEMIWNFFYNPRCFIQDFEPLQPEVSKTHWSSSMGKQGSCLKFWCIDMYLDVSGTFSVWNLSLSLKISDSSLHGVQKSRLEYQNARLRKDLKSMTRFIDSSVLLAAALQTWLRGAVAAQITIHLCHFVQSRHNRTFWKRGHSNIPLIKRKATEERKRHRKNTLNYWVALQKHWTFTDVHWHFHFHLRREETFLFACSRGNDMNTKRWEFQHTRPSHDFQHTTNTAHSLHGPRVARGADPAAVHALIRHGHRVHLRTIQASEGQFVSVTILCVSFHHFFKFVTNVTNV